MRFCTVPVCKWESSPNMTHRLPFCLRCLETSFKILLKIFIASEHPFGIPTKLWHYCIHSKINRHCKESIFQINTGNSYPCLNSLKNTIYIFHFKTFIIYMMMQMFQMVLKEPTFFCLVRIVEIKPRLSPSHSIITTLAKSFLISVFMTFLFITWNFGCRCSSRSFLKVKLWTIFNIINGYLLWH